MRKYILFIVFFCTSILYGFSQSNIFEEGYYISLNNDTIRGFIRLDNDYSLVNEAVFKIAVDSKEKIILTPNQTKKFVTKNHRIFERLELTKKHDGNTITYYLFGKVLVKGICSFYSISTSSFDEDKAFVIEKNCNNYILTQNNKVISNNMNDITVKDFKYVGILNMLLGECDSIKNILPRIQFNENSIISIVQKYNRIMSKTNNTSVCKSIETFIPINRTEIKHLLYGATTKFINIESYKLLKAYGFGYSLLYYNPDNSRFFSYSIGLQYTLLQYEITNKLKYASYSATLQKGIIDMPFAFNILILKKTNYSIMYNIGISTYYTSKIKYVEGSDYGVLSYKTSQLSFNNHQFGLALFSGLSFEIKNVYTQIIIKTPKFAEFKIGIYLVSKKSNK
jgi:hypothetical protein